MRPLDTISALNTSKKYIVTYDGQKFWELNAEVLTLPCKAYIPVFLLVDQLINVVMPANERELFIEHSWLGWLINALTWRMPVEETEKFVAENPMMQLFAIIPENEYIEV